jgi:BA14K-like protein
MSKLGIVVVTVLSLASAVASPAFAVELRGAGGMMDDVGSGGFSDAQASVIPNVPHAAHCAQRWAYYEPATGKYMGDDGQWRPCL